MAERSPPGRRRQRGATVLILVAVVAGMIGLTFASVPLYRIFCGATGFGGTTQRAAAAPDEISARAGHGQLRRADRAGPRLGVPPADTLRSRSIRGRRPRSFSARSTAAPASVTARAVYNVTPSQDRDLFRQAAMLLLQQPDLGAGAKGRYGGRVLCRSRHAEGSRHARRAHDHPVLHDVSGSRARAAAPSAEAAPTPVAGATLRKLTDPRPRR